MATVLFAAFAFGFKGVAALCGLFLGLGGYLGYKYGSAVEKKAQAALAKASAEAGAVEKKL